MTAPLTLVIDWMPSTASGADMSATLKLLARADFTASVCSLQSLLWRLFGHDADAAIPVGALAALGAELDVGGHNWVLAEQAWLVADRDKLYLSNPSVRLRLKEQHEIETAFTRHFGEDGWVFHWLDSGCAVLRAPVADEVRLVPMQQALGQDVHMVMPDGEGRMAWRAFLNELQMLLHGMPFNHAREVAGEGEINALWTWGNGVLPPPAESPIRAVFANELFSRGMASLHGVALHDLTPKSITRSSPEPVLVVLEPRDPQRLESEWMLPLLLQVKSGRWSQVDLHWVGVGHFQISPRTSRRWWRGVKPLSHWAQMSAKEGE